MLLTSLFSFFISTSIFSVLLQQARSKRYALQTERPSRRSLASDRRGAEGYVLVLCVRTVLSNLSVRVVGSGGGGGGRATTSASRTKRDMPPEAKITRVRTKTAHHSPTPAHPGCELVVVPPGVLNCRQIMPQMQSRCTFTLLEALRHPLSTPRSTLRSCECHCSGCYHLRRRCAVWSSYSPLSKHSDQCSAGDHR